MFSQQERCIYRKNPLAEVICQLRFPEILSIQTQLPANFQEAIREEYPQYSARNEVSPPKFTGTPGNLTMEKQTATTNYQFASPDGVWRINLTSKFISLSCSRYTCWEDFARKLDQPLAAFIKLYKPAYFERIGLRYINFISKKALELEALPFSQLIDPCYLGPLGQEDVDPAAVTRCSMDFEMNLHGGCKAKIHAGPGMVKRNNVPDPEVKFVFDMDLYMAGNVPVNYSAGALQTLHSQAYPIFRGAVTETLQDAMEPQIL